jgi:hypothetical protein
MSDTPLVSVEKSGKAWHLTLHGDTEAGQALQIRMLSIRHCRESGNPEAREPCERSPRPGFARRGENIFKTA